MYAFAVYTDIDELKQYRGGPGAGDAATIMGIDYPNDEYYSVYTWNNSSTVTESLPEIIQPVVGDPTIGRWVRVDAANAASPPVNADWNASSGLARILNKPSLSNVATSGNYNDLTSRPTLATVASTGSYVDLLNKPTIPVLSFSSPSLRTVGLATAYQANDTTKPAQITVNLTSTSSISLSGSSNNEGEVRIGPLATVASGASGSPVGIYRNNLGGTLIVGLTLTTQSCQTVSFTLPTGWYFAIRQTSGTGLNIVSAYEQSIG